MTTAIHVDENCLFCKIVKGTIPSFKIYEDEDTYVFLDINPIADGHMLVIPKYHGETLDDLPDDVLSKLLPVAKKVALATGVPQYNIVQNNGKLAFQHVFHVHFHVVPKPNEKEGLIIGEQNWPQKPLDKDALAATAERIRNKL